ncbi:MAG: class I SAM-dependent methyltransferase [Candidatus Aerophobus sp.]|nr:MAG: class I SAM-dependent methyltransferase [Candidatus Aerophobus sp.]
MKSITHFDEGLGTVYERFILNSFFDALIDSCSIHEVLEVPIYGMTGLTGINSVHFVDRGCNVTLLDSKKERIDEANEMWKALPYNGRYKVLYHEDLSELPFGDRSFDLVWDFAALWHVREADLLLSEMARVSSNLVLIIVPNKKQIGYLFRKYIFDKGFFEVVDERWAEIERVSSLLTSLGLKMKDRGVLDVPPWPDTCIPIGQILEKLRIRKDGKGKGSKSLWSWDIMSYYLGKDQTLKERVERFSFLERISIPWQLKAFWAHHRYVIFSKN